MLLSGCTVLSGEGKYCIIAVGEYSAVGKIKKILSSSEDDLTPL
jgi:magnesium-transporting ATPase (P-type)